MYIHQKIDEILKSETKERILCFTEEAEMRKLLESVILGYLEMMQMKEKQENKKSQRINRYVCERI